MLIRLLSLPNKKKLMKASMKKNKRNNSTLKMKMNSNNNKKMKMKWHLDLKHLL